MYRKSSKWKVRKWTRRQLKKARWQRSLGRARKRGPVYGGYVRLTDELELWPLDDSERKEYRAKE